MAQKPIRINGFPGLNNVDSTALIKSLLNMDALPGGTEKEPGGPLAKRDGFSLWLALAGAHSLWADIDGTLYCAAAGTTSLERLVKIDRNKGITTICDITGSGLPLYFVRVADRLFISSAAWNGVYQNGAIRAWGEEYSDDLADFTNIEGSEELLTHGAINAPQMENLALAGGRIFGSVGSRVYYNDPPFGYEMYRRDAFHDFSGDLTMIAQTAAGLYFATDHVTWFASGLDPEQFQFTIVGDGAVPGSLQYLENFKGQANVPVWVSPTGVQAGIQGQVIPLTQNAVRFDVGGRAASYQDQRHGGHYVTTMPLPDVGFGDQATCEVFRNGALITT